MDKKRSESMPRPGEPVNQVFLLKEKSVQTAKNGKKYLTLTLSDRSGDVEGKLWDDAEIVDARLEKARPVKVEGTWTVYWEKLQVTVQRITVLEWSEEFFGQLLPESKVARGELDERLRRLLATVESRPLKRLVELVLADQALWERFLSVPAAKKYHHAYLRGLAEHTLSMMELASDMDHYNEQFPGFVDRDLLVVGTLVHDLGKTREYSYERGIDITTQGRLVGHIVLGTEMLGRFLEQVPGFPPELADRLRHLVVSHHGELEKGSPMVPITPEALLLHHIDYLDSELNGLALLYERPETAEWSAWSDKFERRFLSPYFTGEAAGPRPRGKPGPGEVPSPGRPGPEEAEPEPFRVTEFDLPAGDAERSAAGQLEAEPAGEEPGEQDGKEDKPPRQPPRKGPKLPGLF